MTTKQTTEELLVSEDTSCVRRVAQVLDHITTGKNLNHQHPAWGDCAQDHLDDVLVLSECVNCGETFNQFYHHIVPSGLPVVFQFKFISPISFLMFLVVRRSKLSMVRLKHRKFDEDELHRIAISLGELSCVEFKVYDTRHVAGTMSLDGDKSLVLISM